MNKSSRSQGKIKMGSKRGRLDPDIVDAGWHQRRSVMPVRAESSIPAMRDGWERQTAESVWRQGVGMLRSAHAYSTFRPEPRMPEPRMGASADFCIVCLWSAMGLTLTGLLFALGLGPGQILAMAG
jgi:hypothetical protein